MPHTTYNSDPNMAVLLLDPPHPWLLPLLALLVLFEVGAALGKRQWCQALAKEVKGLTIRKVDVMLQMNKVSSHTQHTMTHAGRSGAEFSHGGSRQAGSVLTIHPLFLLYAIQTQLGIPTDFVKKSKLERELIQLDKDLAPRKERLAKQAAEYERMVGKAKVRKRGRWSFQSWLSYNAYLHIARLND